MGSFLRKTSYNLQSCASVMRTWSWATCLWSIRVGSFQYITYLILAQEAVSVVELAFSRPTSWIAEESRGHDLIGPQKEEGLCVCGDVYSCSHGFLQLSRIEYIHSKDFIHRDIKPDNFLMGLGKKGNLVYVSVRLHSSFVVFYLVHSSVGRGRCIWAVVSASITYLDFQKKKPSTLLICRH